MIYFTEIIIKSNDFIYRPILKMRFIQRALYELYCGENVSVYKGAEGTRRLKFEQKTKKFRKNE